jgi:glutaredoxin
VESLEHGISMNPRDNEKHEEEHEYSKKEKEESEQPVIVSNNHKITNLIRTH